MARVTAPWVCIKSVDSVFFFARPDRLLKLEIVFAFWHSLNVKVDRIEVRLDYNL